MKIALAQICTTDDVAANLEQVAARAAEAAAHRAELVHRDNLVLVGAKEEAVNEPG